MQRILAWFAFGIFLAGAGTPLAPVSAQQTLGAPGETASPLEKGRLGAELRDLTEQSVKTLGLTQERAVLVVLPVAGGPAELAGLHAGDVIVEFEGAAVGPLPDLVAAIQRAGAGGIVTFGVLRGKPIRSQTTAKRSTTRSSKYRTRRKRSSRATSGKVLTASSREA
jgi:S1-C subfamily serine protease